jgi:endonuclease III
MVLQKSVETKHWTRINETFVAYGQNICLPKNPKCKICHLTKICKYYKKNS